MRLCTVCGARGPKVCAGCKKVSYCSKEHQKKHWFNGHSKECSSGVLDSFMLRRLSYPQFEIVIEEENLSEYEAKVKDFAREKGLLKQYEGSVKSLNQQDRDELSAMDFDNLHEHDPVFDKFQTRICVEPTQCLRYDRKLGSSPLWVSSASQIKTEDVPPCQVCGSARVFEFQILPQVLHFLAVDGWEGSRASDVDWGTLAVYTCSESCGDGSKQYFEEFIWYQASSGSI